MGAHHSAVVTDPGHVLTFGRNSEGQLGTGNARLHAAPFEVPIFQEKSAQVKKIPYHFRPMHI